MPTQIDISQDCRNISILGGPSSAEYDLYYNNFQTASEIYELDDPLLPYDPTTNPYSLVTNPTLDSGGNLFLTSNNIGNATTEKMGGIFFIVITDGAGVQSTVGGVAPCLINCCLANKLEELLACTCGSCKECTNLLDDTAKIYLLLQGAIVNTKDCVQTLENYQKAYDKYLKAVDMCGVSNCNCNC